MTPEMTPEQPFDSSPSHPRHYRPDPNPAGAEIRAAADVLARIAELALAERDRLLGVRPDLEEELLTAADVMRILRIGRTRYQQLVGEGTLASIKPGRERLVPASAIRDYIRATLERMP